MKHGISLIISLCIALSLTSAAPAFAEDMAQAEAQQMSVPASSPDYWQQVTIAMQDLMSKPISAGAQSAFSLRNFNSLLRNFMQNVLGIFRR